MAGPTPAPERSGSPSRFETRALLRGAALTLGKPVVTANRADGEETVLAGVLSSFWRPRLAGFFGRRRRVKGSSSDENGSSELLLVICIRGPIGVLFLGEMVERVFGILVFL